MYWESVSNQDISVVVMKWVAVLESCLIHFCTQEIQFVLSDSCENVTEVVEDDFQNVT